MPGLIEVRGAIHGRGYRLFRPLVVGDSSLFEARHEQVPGTCVVRLFPEIGAGSDTALRIESGARLASDLRHSSVARVLDFSVTGQQPVFVAMERIGGRSVEQMLTEDGIFPLELAVEVVEQVAEALRAAHAAGIVHGDLHPGGIRLVDEGGGRVVAKVLGFGWAKELRANDSDPRRVIYRAPELQQRRAERNPAERHSERSAPDGSADQFALAAIAYEMLAGCAYLSEESSDLADPEARRFRQPPRVAEMVMGLPTRLDDVLRKALSFDSQQRFPDVRAFAMALRQLTATDEPITAPPERLATPPIEPAFDGRIVIEEALTASVAGARPTAPASILPFPPGVTASPGWPAAPGASSATSPLGATHTLPGGRLANTLARLPLIGRLNLSARGRVGLVAAVAAVLIAGVVGAVTLSMSGRGHGGAVPTAGVEAPGVPAAPTPIAPDPPAREAAATEARVEPLPSGDGRGARVDRKAGVRANTTAAKSARSSKAAKAAKVAKARKARKARLARRARHAATQ